jgi:hypothetical protein
VRADSPARTQRITLALALIALAAALVGALGPAKKEQASYSWPPAHLPEGKPARQWYSPLLLIRRTPATLDATVPCQGIRALPGASQPLTVLATARSPSDAGGLAVIRTGSRFDFSLGGDTFATYRSPEASEQRGCTLRLHLEDDRWSIAGPDETVEGGLEGQRPIVSGFFSAVDLTAGPRPSIEVTTEPFGTRPTAYQTAAWILAAMAIAAVFGLLVGSRRLEVGRLVPIPAAGRVVRALRPVDLFVAVLLLAWWVLGPVLYDDGWVKVRQTNYQVSGGFSNYYSSFGVNLPLDYWLEWMQQWVVGHSDTLLVLRLPALALLTTAWILCRWSFSRVTSDSEAPRTGALWTLGVAFVLSALAWDMTLRPEPVVALLTVGTLASAIRFLERPSASALIVGALLVVLGVTAHPAGLVTAAPLLIVSPSVIRWLRGKGWVLPTALGLTVIALALVVAAVGSDLFQRAADARGIRIYGDATRSWREELDRYLLVTTGASPMRRASVALMIAAVIAYLVRRSRTARPLLDLPAASLALALVLMVPTPSKWIWHFGVFAGLAAVAVASELVRLREQAANRWALTPFLAAFGAMLVAAWAWFPRIEWGDFDLRTLDWTIDLEERVTAVRLSAAIVVAGLGVVILVELVRRGWSERARATWSTLPWLVPLAVLPIVGFTVGMLALDTAKTPAWTVARQNLESLRGDAGCGLADDTTVTAPTSVVPLRPTAEPVSSVGPWTQPTPFPGLQRFSLFAGGRSNTITTPWYRVPRDGRRVGFFVSTGLAGGEAVEVRWGNVKAGEVLAVKTTRVEAGSIPSSRPAAETGVIQANEFGGEPVAVPAIVAERLTTIPWTFIPEGRLPSRPSSADLIQLRLRSEADPPRALALTGAVSYRTTNLRELVSGADALPLVWPNLALYIPCRRQPRLSHGIVEVPTVLVARSGLWPIEFTTSPFHSVLDLYRLRDLSVGDSAVEPESMQVFWVDRKVPGTVLAPVERTRAT